jgi:hypothetical protein
MRKALVESSTTGASNTCTWRPAINSQAAFNFSLLTLNTSELAQWVAKEHHAASQLQNLALSKRHIKYELFALPLKTEPCILRNIEVSQAVLTSLLYLEYSKPYLACSDCMPVRLEFHLLRFQCK